MTKSTQGFRFEQGDVYWRAVWTGYGVALAGTLVLGLALFIWDANVWWIVLAGVVSLYGGGLLAGLLSGGPEPLNGALVGLAYFATVAVVIFAGAASDVLPDPLPGLPRGDSTLFMAWPLGQLASSTLGALSSGLLLGRRNATRR
jgi:hypothetical protein